MDKLLNSKWKYVLVVFSIAVVAGLGALFVNLGLDWFQTLNTPSKFVSGTLISVVWSVIYISFVIILCLWLSGAPLPKSTLILLAINGVLNVLWCLLFFTFNNTILGLVAIIVNLILAYILIINIFKKVPVFGYILSIYPLWISIATCLNLALWILN